MNEIKKATASDFLLWIFRLRKRFQVDGHSMLPTLKPGDQVFVKPSGKKDIFSIGDIVVARHPFKESTKLIKQVSDIDSKGRVKLEGINKNDSLDSRSLGIINKKLIIGRLTSVL